MLRMFLSASVSASVSALFALVSSAAFSSPVQSGGVLVSCSIFDQDGESLESLESGSTAESSTDSAGNNAYTGEGTLYKFSAYKKDLATGLYEIQLLDKRSGYTAQTEKVFHEGKTVTLRLKKLEPPVTTMELVCKGY